MSHVLDAEPAAPTDAAPVVTRRRLIGNTLANGVANAWSALVTIALTPFLLHHLGADGYGIWVLALGLTFTSGYLALADLGLGEAAVRFVAGAHANQDRDEISRIAATTLAVFVVVGLLLGGLTWLFAPLLVQWFGVPPSLLDAARLLFGLMGLEILVELPQTALRSVFEGLQRYALLRAVDVVGRLGWAIAVVVVVLQGHGIVALGVVTLAAAVARGLATWVLVHLMVPGLRLGPRQWSRRVLRAVLGFGSMVAGLRVLTIIYAQMDRVIIGVVLGVASVAGYEIAFRIQSVLTLVLVMASSAVVPAAAYNAMRGDSDRQRALYVKGTKLTIACTLPVGIAALFLAGPLLRGWIGPHEQIDLTAARLFAVFPMFASLNQVGVAMLIGLGRVGRVLAYQAVAVAVNLGLSIALAGPLGVTGVVIGTLVGGLVTWIPYCRLLLRTFGVPLRTLLHEAVRPAIGPSAAQVAVGLLLIPVAARTTNLVAALALFAVSVGVFAVAYLRFGLSPEERPAVLQRPGRRDPRGTAHSRSATRGSTVPTA